MSSLPSTLPAHQFTITIDVGATGCSWCLDINGPIAGSPSSDTLIDLFEDLAAALRTERSESLSEEATGHTEDETAVSGDVGIGDAGPVA